jgi:hypothetical protein
MASGFPGSIDNFTDPLGNSPLTSPDHATLHSDVNDAVEKIETYMGLVKVIPTSVAGTGVTLNANGTVTFSASSTVSINGCFSSLFENYKVVITHVASTSTSHGIRLRASGTDNSTASSYVRERMISAAGTVSGATVTSDSWSTALAGNGSISTAEITFARPFLAETTGLMMNVARSDAVAMIGGFHNQSVSYDGFSILAGVNTITGTLRIYGYGD